MDEKSKSVFLFADMKSGNIAESLSEVNTDELPPDALVPARVPVFREGEFEHPLYGDLEFDTEFLNRLISNYKRSVLHREVAFDVSHRRYDGGAIAWIREDVAQPLTLEKVEVPTPGGGTRMLNVLFADIFLNRRGAKLVQGHEYRYFSAEINQNYTTREKVSPQDLTTMSGLETRELDDEDRILVEHGPTLMGGGITNNPFIPGLGEVKFTDDGVEVDEAYDANFEFDKEAKMGFFGFAPKENQTFDEDTVVEDFNDEDVEDLENDDTQTDVNEFTGEDAMDLKELIAKLSAADGPEARLAILEDASQEYSSDTEGYTVVKTMLADAKEAVENKRQFEEAARKAARAQEERDNLRKENADLKFDLQKEKEVSFTKRVGLFCKEQEDDNHYPAVVNKVRDILLSSPVEARETNYKFSDDEDAKEFNLMEALGEILASLPEEARMDFTENLSDRPGAGSEGDGDDEVNPDDVDLEGDDQEFDDEDEKPAHIQLAEEKQGAEIPEEFWELYDEEGELHWTPQVVQ